MEKIQNLCTNLYVVGKNRFGKEFDPCWCPVGEVGAGADAQWEKWQGNKWETWYMDHLQLA